MYKIPYGYSYLYYSTYKIKILLLFLIFYTIFCFLLNLLNKNVEKYFILEKTPPNILFINVIILTFTFIIKELKVTMYIKMPIPIPRTINKRISPLENVHIEYNNIRPARIQKIMSSIYVTKSFVEKDFLSILKKSNNKPIITPTKIKIRNK